MTSESVPAARGGDASRTYRVPAAHSPCASTQQNAAGASGSRFPRAAEPCPTPPVT
jgi:hypothetical protein